MRPLDQITEWHNPHSGVEVVIQNGTVRPAYRVLQSVITPEVRVVWPGGRPGAAVTFVTFEAWARDEARRLCGRVKRGPNGMIAVFA